MLPRDPRQDPRPGDVVTVPGFARSRDRLEVVETTALAVHFRRIEGRWSRNASTLLEVWRRMPGVEVLTVAEAP